MQVFFADVENYFLAGRRLPSLPNFAPPISLMPCLPGCVTGTELFSAFPTDRRSIQQTDDFPASV